MNGKVVSKSSTSFEKRARIRPRGVTSKNESGDPKMPLSIVMCNALAAYQHPKRGAKSANTEPNAAK